MASFRSCQTFTAGGCDATRVDVAVDLREGEDAVLSSSTNGDWAPSVILVEDSASVALDNATLVADAPLSSIVVLAASFCMVVFDVPLMVVLVAIAE